MEKLQLKIYENNKLFTYKDRQIRTPTILTIYKSEINQIKLSLKILGITDYEILGYEDDTKIIKKVVKKEKDIEKEMIIEDLKEINKEDPKTILEKLLKNGEL